MVAVPDHIPEILLSQRPAELFRDEVANELLDLSLWVLELWFRCELIP